LACHRSRLRFRNSTARGSRAGSGKTLYVLAMSNIAIGGIAAPVVRLGRISDIARHTGGTRP
jgi:hypothetical protein